jgi:hypothetical protein
MIPRANAHHATLASVMGFNTSEFLERKRQENQRHNQKMNSIDELLAEAARQIDLAEGSKPGLTQAKLNANRANSKLSTGPKSTPGKAASSNNALKHGLYSSKVVLPGEDPAELDALRADLLAEHQPGNETEKLLVLEMADNYWRLRRARMVEVHVINEGAEINQLAAVQRMMNSAERGFYRALKTLKELQKARGFVPQTAPPVDSSTRPLVHSSTSESGFVPLTRPATASAAPETAPEITKNAV